MKLLHDRRQTSGFTIVELLIVIVVIAILASITIVVYNGMRQRAQAAAISTDIKGLTKGFRLLLTEQGRSTWWIDNELTGTGNPTIQSVISGTNLKNYFQQLSSSTTSSSTSVIYDNDGDAYGGCSSDSSAVNIYFYTVDSALAQQVDNVIDDGNLGCGALTYGVGAMRYNMSKDSSQ